MSNKAMTKTVCLKIVLILNAKMIQEVDLYVLIKSF